MEKKIPSAEELLRETYKIMSDESIEDIAKVMREFAKLHIEACKKEISRNTKNPDNLAETCFEDMKKLNPKGGIREFIRLAVNFGYNERSKEILNLYPLENIK